MIALWMAYAVLVALLLGGAAAALERVLRLQGRPGRWVWGGALAASWAVPVATALAPVAESGATRSAGGPAAGVDPALLARLLDQAGALPVAGRSLLEPLGTALIALWIVLGAAGVLLFGLALRRVLRRVRSWPRARVLDETVRVSPDFGPAVVGLRRPDIVLPGWVLALGTAGQRMVLRHEQEHRAARDTLLLAGGTVATLAAPWNPALWWQLRRLRLAVELDCDARVLGSGVSPRRYGDLLLHVGERMVGSVVPVAALAEPPSFLERRLKMITGRKRTGGTTWKTAVGLVTAGLLVGVACEAPAPTVTEPGPEAEAVAQEAPAGVVRAAGKQPLIYVDGIRVEQATSDGDAGQLRLGDIEPADIARIEVVKGTAAEARYGSAAAGGVIQIYTKGSAADTVVEARWVREEPEADAYRLRAIQEKAEVEAERAAAGGTYQLTRVPGREGSNARSALEEITASGAKKAQFMLQKLSEAGTSLLRRRSSANEIEDVPPPLIVVDGEVWSRDALDRLEAEDIDRVEVLKGDAARAAWGSRGSNGVILITLKH